VAVLVPKVETHSVAHSQLVNAHGIENPRVVIAQPKQVDIELLTILVNKLYAQRYFGQLARGLSTMPHQAIILRRYYLHAIVLGNDYRSISEILVTQ
jgi:hypothetical protein